MAINNKLPLAGGGSQELENSGGVFFGQEHTPTRILKAQGLARRRVGRAPRMVPSTRYAPWALRAAQAARERTKALKVWEQQQSHPQTYEAWQQDLMVCPQRE